MVLFSLSDFYSIILVSIALLLSAFALFLPIYFLKRDLAYTLSYVIPISFSFEIIFGYFFYCFKVTEFFPIAYIFVILALNAIAYRKIRPKWILTKKVKVIPVLMVVFLVALSIYARFYDSLTTLAPGGTDTTNHIYFLKDIIESGRISTLSYYAPGFHLLIYPVSFLVKINELYRFVGPIFGIIILLSFYLLINQHLKNTYSKIFFVLLSSIPAFAPLTLQTIYFFPSAISFIFFISFIFLLGNHKKADENINFYVYSLLTVGMALTIPYLFVEYLFALIPLVALWYILANKRNNHITLFMLKIILVPIFGLVVAFAHVFIQTSVLSSENRFPTIPAISQEGSRSETISNFETSTSITSNGTTKFLTRYDHFSIIKNYAVPMANTLYDVLKIKNFRPVSGLLAIISYGWVLLSVFLVFYAIKTKNNLLLAISIFSIIFGISTQTGIMEMSFYRGRSGWYLMILALLGTTLIFDEILMHIKKKMFIVCLIIPAFTAMSFWSIMSPPIFYRTYHKEIFDLARKISIENQSQKIFFVTNIFQGTQTKLFLLADNIYTVEPEDYLDNNNLVEGVYFFAIEKTRIPIDPVLSGRAYNNDKGFKLFNVEQNKIKAKKNTADANLLNLKNKKLYFEDSKIAIYKIDK